MSNSKWLYIIISIIMCIHLTLLFLPVSAVYESILIIQGCKSYQVLFSARGIHRFHWQGKDILLFWFEVLLFELESNYKVINLSCADAMHLFSRKGKKNSEIVLSGMWAYGAVCQITVLVIYIMICTGMRNQDGKQFLLKLLRMIIHRIEINLDLCLLKHWWIGE